MVTTRNTWYDQPNLRFLTRIPTPYRWAWATVWRYPHLELFVELDESTVGPLCVIPTAQTGSNASKCTSA
ncbi:hypothetical protein RJ55_08345 [Drechmeria coniospora]|nr:hypothetical protein RJ55_08345 [Drechmeria coniospora]